MGTRAIRKPNVYHISRLLLHVLHSANGDRVKGALYNQRAITKTL